MSGKPLYLHIPGDPTALEALADALDQVLLTELRDREETLRSNEINLEPSWGGQAADAFILSSKQLSSDIQKKVSDFVSRSGEVIRAYAWRLKRGSALFADYADTAARYGLVVQGEYILAPTRRDLNDADAQCLITDVVGPEQIIPGAGSVFELFREITESVGRWHGENTLWIAENFSPLMQASTSAAGLSQLLDRFEASEKTLFDAALAGRKHTVDDRIAALAEKTKVSAEQLERFNKSLRVGNEELRAAQEGVSGRRLRRGLEEAEEALQSWSKKGSVLRGLGAAGAVVDAWENVSEGQSWGEALSGFSGAVAGAEIGARLGARGGLVGVIVSSGVGAVVGSGVGQLLWGVNDGPYEPAMPLGVREEIESWWANPGALSVNSPKMA